MSQKHGIRIVNVDYYMAPPLEDFDVMYGEFRGGSISHVPVIRIFGSMDSGQKICLHVHGQFPYLYIPHDDTDETSNVRYQIATNIDKALNISFGQGSSNAQHVYQIVLVSGIPFYGYHTKPHQFFKIFLYNPILVRKVSNLLQSEVILGRLYQPHESHIPYILQFMIDYNLHGMSKIFVDDLKFRDASKKQSTCELEADTRCDNILNHLDISQDKFGVNPGIASIWDEERQRLRNKGQDSLIGTCLTLTDTQKEPTKSHQMFKNALVERLLILEDETADKTVNKSVYPSETPISKTLPNASSIFMPSQSSSEENVDLDVTFDEAAQDLFNVLQDLGRRNLNVEEHEDSVLSQVVRKEEDEDLFDLSVSMAETTPFKEVFNDLNVPQLDGQGDEVKKRKYRALPIERSNDSSNETICETVVTCELKPCRNQTVAEMYDIETNFAAKEGCSRVLTQENRVLTPAEGPPNRFEMDVPRIKYQVPFYSNPKDVTGSSEVGHRVLKISSKSVRHLDEMKTTFGGIEEFRRHLVPNYSTENGNKVKLLFCTGARKVITPFEVPPSRSEAKQWLSTKRKEKAVVNVSRKQTIQIDSDSENEMTITQSSDGGTKFDNSCQIAGVTLQSFKIDDYQEVKAVNESENLTILSVEIHVGTRGDLKPNPNYDAVKAIFYSIFEDVIIETGLIEFESESDIFEELTNLVHKYDPDILVGYEIEMLSWGYLFERSDIINNKLLTSISRVCDKKVFFKDPENDHCLKVRGRILLDVWRLLRHEIALQSYTFENMVYHLLNQRVPFYTPKDLTQWWLNPLLKHRTIKYYLLRVQTVLKMLNQLDLIGRTSELARLFGIQFFEVLARGSQYRVESMMLRLAKPLNYIPVSPSVQQRAKMKAPEFLPLILEPESKLYVDPVIVLDFQSLYPSVIIAYNYCFSTCLGKVSRLGKSTPFEFGATFLKVSRTHLKHLLEGDCLNFSPSGVVFVKKAIRDGILPKMLREILETRLMVKNSMKQNRDDRVLQKVLYSRQLGLKLIANVTFGYTAANFSGRMPAVEMADSVLAKSRETLQRAIETVEKNKEWGARVVYGDTDSLFVLVEGRSREEAFQIGKEIAETVTNENPDPVKLKLEKVYQPCILQTKKRYVGYMYESVDQVEPIYQAKGIETVRRDGCPAVAKMLEKCLRLLFDTMDVSLVKSYVLRQFDKILMGRVSLQDLTFAKQYRGRAEYQPGACVPALQLAKKWCLVDPRAEPRRKQRVPYVIVNGPPGVPLIKLVRSPFDFLTDSTLRPNAIYYITKVIIPPINRCFTLIGADLNVWFNQMPRKYFQYLRNPTSPVKKSTISQYFASTSCAVCGTQTNNKLCEECLRNKQKSCVVLFEKMRLWEQTSGEINLICELCTGFPNEQKCLSLDCPVLYRRIQASRDSEQTSYIREVIDDFF